MTLLQRDYTGLKVSRDTSNLSPLGHFSRAPTAGLEVGVGGEVEGG